MSKKASRFGGSAQVRKKSLRERLKPNRIGITPTGPYLEWDLKKNDDSPISTQVTSRSEPNAAEEADIKPVSKRTPASDSSTAKIFAPLIRLKPFVFPVKFEKKYEIIRGHTLINIIYDKPTFTMDVWHFGLPGFVGKPLPFEARDYLQLMRENPILNNYQLGGVTPHSKHMLIVIFERKTPEAYIAPRNMAEFLYTIPTEQTVAEIRKLAVDSIGSRKIKHALDARASGHPSLGEV